MRSYTNKKGEVISVSEEHLETALRLKEKLQSDNGQNKCAWGKHKQLMVKEDFKDSENSENYRQMIKRYQKSVDKLPTSEKLAKQSAMKELESYKELVGEITWQKQEMQPLIKEIRKGKKEIIDKGLLAQSVTDAVQNVLSNVKWDEINSQVFTPISNHSDDRMIAVVTDWHIGAIVDIDGNKFNLEIAKERLERYANEVLAIAHERKIYRIDVVYCGDILEHAYMRGSQAYSAEFDVSHQMVIGAELLIELLVKLSKEHFVSFRGFSGNHDRLNGDKNNTIHGDTGMVVVNKIVEVFIQLSKKENLIYAEAKPYSAVLLDINGKNIKFVHGDKDKKNDDKKIKNHSFDDNITYDAIVYGHFHHYMALEVGINKWEIRMGSLKGSDDFSESLGLGSAPSQGIIIVTGDGDILPQRIGLL